jgi:hypothetical protein
MLQYLRKLLGLKQIEDDLLMLKEEVDQLSKLAEAALTRDIPRGSDSEGGWREESQPKKEMHATDIIMLSDEKLKGSGSDVNDIG